MKRMHTTQEIEEIVNGSDERIAKGLTLSKPTAPEGAQVDVVDFRSTFASDLIAMQATVKVRRTATIDATHLVLFDLVLPKDIRDKVDNDIMNTYIGALNAKLFYIADGNVKTTKDATIRYGRDHGPIIRFWIEGANDALGGGIEYTFRIPFIFLVSKNKAN